jgi:hypothetical protein
VFLVSHRHPLRSTRPRASSMVANPASACPTCLLASASWVR